MRDQVDERSVALTMTDEQRSTLEEWAAREDAPSLARRARIVLEASKGQSTVQIARELGVSRQTVALWRRRFVEGGLEAVAKIKHGRGRRPSIPPQKVRQIVELARQPPPPGKKRWTVRSVASRVGVSPDTVQRIWRSHGLLRDTTASVATPSRQPELVSSPQLAEPIRRPSAHNLPLPFSTFVGRRRELASLQTGLAESRLVTLIGEAGVGKSRLALETATNSLARYPEGAWLVDLGAVGEEHLLAHAVASTLGVAEPTGRGAVDSLVAFLRRRPLLLVLDNGEHLRSALAELVAVLFHACPDLTILATSRHPLEVAGERVWPVRPLSVPGRDAAAEDVGSTEAVQLFAERAASKSSAFALTEEVGDDVAEICRRLDGNPLAIELAAAQVETMPPATILDRLEEQWSEAAARDGDTDDPEQRLGAAIAWSYELLSEPQKLLLRRLAVFAGDITLEAAEEVCADEQLGVDDVFYVLAALVERSFVVGEVADRNARYRLLHSIRRFARARFEESDDADTVRAQFVRWCEELVAQAEPQLSGPSQQTWLARLEAEHENVLAAVDYSLAHGDPGSALRLAAGMGPFWRLRGYLREGGDLLQRCLQASDAADEGADGRVAASRPKASWEAGLLSAMLGDFATARACGEESLRAAEDASDHAGTARAFSLLALVNLYGGDPSAAVELAEHSVMAARRARDDRCLADALERLGQAHLLQGDPQRALPLFEECHRVARDLGDRQAEAFALIGQGWVAMDLGEYELAEARMRLAADLTRCLGDRFRTGEVLVYMGELSRRRGDLDDAEEVFNEGRRLAETLAVPQLQARALGGLARVALAREHYETACALFDQGITIARDVSLPYVLARLLLGRSAGARACGDLAVAGDALAEAEAIAGGHEDRQALATCQHALASLARDRDDPGESARRHAEALELHTQAGDSESVAGSLEGIAGVALDRGHHRLAARLFGAAEAQRRRIGRYSARWPWEAERYSRDRAELDAALTAEERDRLWQEGSERSLDDIVTYALRGAGRRQRTATGPAGLTASEVEVARLAVQGLTSREIGERLFISPRTVDAHLARVYRKLGIGSRQELRDRMPDLHSVAS